MQFAQTRKAWLTGGALVAFLLVAASWLLLISPEFSNADNLHSQADSVATNNIVLEGKIAKLRKQAEQLDTYKEQLRTALAQLPASSNIPTFTRQLTAQAAKTGVTLTSITVGAPTLLAAGGNAAPAAGGSTAAPEASPSATSSAAQSPAPAPTTGIYASQVSLATSGSLKAQQAFVRAIQSSGPRTALIASLQFSPGGGTGSKGSSLSIDQSCTMNVQLSVFDQPVSAAQVAALQKLLAAQPAK